MIITVLYYIAIWVSIGLIVNILDIGKVPFSKDFTKEDKKVFYHDIILGPIGVIAFIIFVIVKTIKK